MVVRVKWGGAGARQGPNIPVMSVLSMPWLSPFWNQPLISTLLLLWNRKGIHWKLGFGMLDQIQWIIVFSTSVPFFLQVVCFKMIPLKMRSLEKMIISPNTKISSEVDWHPHTKSPQLPETFFFFLVFVIFLGLQKSFTLTDLIISADTKHRQGEHGSLCH